MTTSQPVDEMISKVLQREKRAKQRAILFTFLPLLACLALIAYTSQRVVKANKELATIDAKIELANSRVNKAEDGLKAVNGINHQLKSENDSLSDALQQSVINLGKAVSITSQFKQFIDKMEPSLRSQGEAAFYINFRMMEERIRGDYKSLSEKVAGLPNLDEGKTWIVIVGSSMSLEDLKSDAPRLANIYGKDQVAVYKDDHGNYALSVKGNGTFTRAYRLNVELRDKYKYTGAYFSSAKDWGRNYLE
jgi:hypothetical protein